MLSKLLPGFYLFSFHANITQNIYFDLACSGIFHSYDIKKPFAILI